MIRKRYCNVVLVDFCYFNLSGRVYPSTLNIFDLRLILDPCPSSIVAPRAVASLPVVSLVDPGSSIPK